MAFHLNPVAPPVAPAGVGQPLLETTPIRQQEKSLAVGIQPAGWIDMGHVDVIRESLPVTSGLRGELAEHPVGLVEQDDGQR